MADVLNEVATPALSRPQDDFRRRRHIAPAILVIALAVLPMAASALGQEYYVTFATRMLVLAIAAVGLNLALGFGGMVSFGHALYVGLGAYSVLMLPEMGIQSGLTQLGAALVVGAGLAALIGLVCLRTAGMAFIMITLAFAQMFYYVVVSLKRYGGDDGMRLDQRSTFLGTAIEDATGFYYLVFGALMLILCFVSLMANARFGWALRGCRLNARRMAALGYPVLRYRLAAYVLSAMICILAGFLLANLTRFVSPSYLQWSLSGELLVMVVLGGMGTVFGPVWGAVFIVVLEELLINFPVPLPGGAETLVRSHFMGLIGIFIALVSLGTRHGLVGILSRSRE